MRKEYNLKKMKVKRRGMLPELVGTSPEQAKIRITIALDQDVVEYFKSQAKKPGALPYQTQINQSLRAMLPSASEHTVFYEQIKFELLHDKSFVFSLLKIFKKAS